MIECFRDEQGNITAVIEYMIFDDDGFINEDGTTLFIGELEINPIHRGNGIVRNFIKILLDKLPKIESGFFYRKKKYPNRNYRMYSRKQFELLIK